MKKLLFTCFTGMLLTWTMTSVGYSQSSDSKANPGYSPAKFISSSAESNATEKLNLVIPAEVNTKAVRHFNRSFKNAPNARWFTLGTGSVVYFTSDGIKTRVYYTKKGFFEGMILDYFEDKLPPAVRHLVKSTYYDFSIYHINEVRVDGITAYLVKIEDKTSWKIIRVINGEMEVAEEYSKR